MGRKRFVILIVSLLGLLGLLALAARPRKIARDSNPGELEPAQVAAGEARGLSLSERAMSDHGGEVAAHGAPAVGVPADAASVPAAMDRSSFPTTYHVSRDVGTLDTGMRDINGRHIGVPCSTCHVQHAEPPFAERPDQLKEFHTGLRFAHGDQTCSTCHVQEERDKLRLADGRRLEFAEVMTLCAQCHGPQARDYRNGSHGGMNGYWDLKRGPRTRNSCTDCHNPHMPAYPQVMPVFQPKDRFLESKVHE